MISTSVLVKIWLVIPARPFNFPACRRHQETEANFSHDETLHTACALGAKVRLIRWPSPSLFTLIIKKGDDFERRPREIQLARSESQKERLAGMFIPGCHNGRF